MSIQPEKKLSVTVGIPTYWGGPSLVRSVKSILASRQVEPFRLIVSVDARPLDPAIEAELRSLGAEILFNEVRAGEIGRTKQLFELCDTDILIITHDDVVFDSSAVHHIVRGFENDSEITMIGANIVPTNPERFFERVVHVGVQMVHDIGSRWHNGDNYLTAIGRCLSYRMSHAKKFVISSAVINTDAYLYFQNKFSGGKYQFCSDAKIFYKSPQTISEHTRQSVRFVHSRDEMERIFSRSLVEYYQIPIKLCIQSVLRQLHRNPFGVLFYVGLQSYVFIIRICTPKPTSNIWNPDITTKR